MKNGGCHKPLFRGKISKTRATGSARARVNNPAEFLVFSDGWGGQELTYPVGI